MNTDNNPASPGVVETSNQTDSRTQEGAAAGSPEAGLPQAKSGRLYREAVEALVTLGLLGDCCLTYLAFFGGFWLWFGTGLIPFLGNPTDGLIAYAGDIAVASFLLLLLLSLSGIYSGSLLLAGQRVVTRMARACMVWLGGSLSFTLFFLSQPHLARLSVALSVTGAGAFAILVGWRIGFHRWVAHSPWSTRLRHRVLFVGWNDDARHLAGAFAAGRPPGYEVVGYVVREDIPAAGGISNLSRILHDKPVDIVIVADGDLPNAEVARLEKLCEEEMVQFHLVLSCMRTLICGTSVDVIGGVPVLGTSKLPLDRFCNGSVKRAMDIAGAAAGLILGAPLIAIFGLWVYLESPGPVFYRQCRLGWNGRPFHIIKIRSMRLDAEKDGVGWTTKNDPRRLAIGAFLRKWNIDELPQFWNVLKGDMSLVGPRAERPELIRIFQKEIPHYNVRHSVRPGMSGWAQVNGFRGDTDLTERVRYDLYYIENWSILFDIKIMVRTFLVCGGS